MQDSIFAETVDMPTMHNMGLFQSSTQSVKSTHANNLLKLNEAAMTAMRHGEMTQARTALKACEHIMNHPESDGAHEMTPADRQKIRALTFNNLGCYYRK